MTNPGRPRWPRRPAGRHRRPRPDHRPAGHDGPAGGGGHDLDPRRACPHPVRSASASGTVRPRRPGGRAPGPPPRPRPPTRPGPGSAGPCRDADRGRPPPGRRCHHGARAPSSQGRTTTPPAPGSTPAAAAVSSSTGRPVNPASHASRRQPRTDPPSTCQPPAVGRSPPSRCRPGRPGGRARGRQAGRDLVGERPPAWDTLAAVPHDTMGPARRPGAAAQHLAGPVAGPDHHRRTPAARPRSRAASGRHAPDDGGRRRPPAPGAVRPGPGQLVGSHRRCAVVAAGGRGHAWPRWRCVR